MIKCPNCGRENADNFNFCLDCGYDLKAYREAFPDGVPSAPPPPAPAVTQTNMHVPSDAEISSPPSAPLPPAPPPAPPIAIPHTFTPAAVQSPLPPLPPRREPTKPQVMLNEPPPSFPPMPSAPPAAPTASNPGFGPPPPMPLPLPSSPTPLPSQPHATSSLPPQSTGVLAAATMPPPPSLSPPPPFGAPRAPTPMPTSLPPLPPAASLPPVPPAPLPRAPTPTARVADIGLPSQPPVATTPPAAAASAQCTSCGYANAATVKFCGNCGKRLDGAAPPAAASEGQGRTMFMHAADMSHLGKDKLCKLITIDQSGREGMTFTIKSGETLCGRVNGIILFFDDPYVSPTHCKFSFLQGKLKVIDQGSLNGVYLRVKGERRLSDGELLRVGRQLFRFESLNNAAYQVKKLDGDDSRIWGSPNPGAFGRLVQILEDGRTGEIRLLSGDRCQLGREVGDIVMPTDGFISGRHCAFVPQNGETVLTDLGSSNGTYVRVRGEADVAHGDFILVGNQMLRVEIV